MHALHEGYELLISYLTVLATITCMASSDPSLR